MDHEAELDDLFRRAGESGLFALAAIIDVEKGLRQLAAETEPHVDRADGFPGQLTSARTPPKG